MTKEGHDGLLRMEHGALGEARARALLAERFWILERSVDVDGADLLIQRHLSWLSDRQQPRLGVVQVKFLQDERTTAYVKAAHVGDQRGPFPFFFLLAHTGLGDGARTFLLSAEDIAADFHIAPQGHTREGDYVLSGNVLLGPKYGMQSVRRALDRIEQALRLADLDWNRQFLFHATPFFGQPLRDQIEPEYLVSIENDWVDISEEFFRLKQRAQNAMYRAEDVVESLKRIIVASDPETALSIAEDLDADLRDGSICLGERIYNQDLHLTVLRHRERHDRLRDAGLLDSFLTLSEEIEAFVADDLATKLPLRHGEGYMLELNYDPATFATSRLTSAVEPLPEGVKPDGPWFDEARLLSSTPGRIKFVWPVGRIAADEPGAKGLNEILRKHVWQVRRPVTDAIYELKFLHEE